ncbi:uncharacterized protein LOC110693128 [Chenopodium quinoa]|uniref:uncharacterized protein LOC110693128 n=1 Tax=Chenopodium quinoa TaxID=63459 RepID=UPI000B77ECD5|nr:uncharacterized protein LOC110693128 [Chenopodium quinoa]
MAFYKSNRNVVAILFILVLVQIMVDKTEADCADNGEPCAHFLGITDCCVGYRCSKGAGYKCVRDPSQHCLDEGRKCHVFSSCCGKNQCTPQRPTQLFTGRCVPPKY